MRERFHLASDEARSAVNDDRMLIEKFVDRRIRHMKCKCVCVCVCTCARGVCSIGQHFHSPSAHENTSSY